MMKANPETRPHSPGKEGWLIGLLCAVAGLRVFLYAAAFPFFCNVDEPAHFDLVLKYSRWQIPSAMESFSPESAPYLALNSSPEYMRRPDEFPGGRFPEPPPGRVSQPDQAQFARLGSRLQSLPNRESSSCPLYYVLAGTWMASGRFCGLEGIHLLYWIRFLNFPLAAALVWLAYLAARLVFPQQRWLRLGVPFLAAFFPQDIYYSIQSDTLSPLCFGAAFIGLVRLMQAEEPRPRLGALTGLALSATWLVKISNLPLVAVAFLGVSIKALNLARAGKLRKTMPALVLLLLCAALPIGAWSLWSLHAFGDPTGSAAKIRLLGWVRKPFLNWWSHPLFHPSGLWTFWSELMASFWRGEFVWGGRRLAMPAVDAFYCISSLVLAGAAVVSLSWNRSGVTVGQRRAFWLSASSFFALAAFLGLVSIAYDFGNCYYPSPDYPYVTSGRLLCGALIPLLLLYVQGLNQACRWLKYDKAPILAVGGIVLLVTVSELIINLPAFSSRYNLFHS